MTDYSSDEAFAAGMSAENPIWDADHQPEPVSEEYKEYIKNVLHPKRPTLKGNFGFIGSAISALFDAGDAERREAWEAQGDYYAGRNARYRAQLIEDGLEPEDTYEYQEWQRENERKRQNGWW